MEQIIYKITLYKNTEDAQNFKVVTTLCDDGETVYAIIYDMDSYWVGTAEFWLVHDRYNIDIIEGDEELAFDIIEQLCQDIINGEIVT